uniref:Uncharacterized protein n=1 Tax=Kwoniella bestiolae CBS 10118 TaxID=1296100 RepID=A0A1B9G0S0_9TREE|nr:hypothetical protein I302_06070 [Kwoniella bestiolae CBS 10118]OCF24609.1 hypothetical protein I302_06070 [Kwoniella bestiolae CBS 10118]
MDSPPPTPPVLHDRINQSAMEHLRQTKQPADDHVILTEHYTTKVFQQLTNVEFTPSEAAMGSRDPYKSYERPLPVPREVQEFRMSIQDNHKRASKQSPGERYLAQPIENPVPSYLQPKDYMLTARAIKKTHTLTEGKRAIPSKCGQLGGKGRFSVLEKVDNKEEERKVDRAEVLKTKVSFSKTQGQQIWKFFDHAALAKKAHLEVARGVVEDRPTVIEWKNITRESIEYLPRPASPPMLPLSHYKARMTGSQAVQSSQMDDKIWWEDEDYERGNDTGVRDHDYLDVDDAMSKSNRFDAKKRSLPISPLKAEQYEDERLEEDEVYEMDEVPVVAEAHYTDVDHEMGSSEGYHMDDNDLDEVYEVDGSAEAPTKLAHSNGNHYEIDVLHDIVEPTPISSPTSGNIRIVRSPQTRIEGQLYYKRPYDEGRPSLPNFIDQPPQWNESTETIFKDWLDPAAFHSPSLNFQIPDNGTRSIQQAFDDGRDQGYRPNDVGDGMNEGIWTDEETALDPAARHIAPDSRPARTVLSHHYPIYGSPVSPVDDNVVLHGMTNGREPQNVDTLSAQDIEQTRTASPAGLKQSRINQAVQPGFYVGRKFQNTIAPILVQPGQSTWTSKVPHEEDVSKSSSVTPQRPRWSTGPNEFYPAVPKSPSPSDKVRLKTDDPTSIPMSNDMDEGGSSTVTSGRPSYATLQPQVVPAKRPRPSSSKQKGKQVRSNAESAEIPSLEDIVLAFKPSKGKKKKTTKAAGLQPTSSFSLDGFLSLQQRDDLITKPKEKDRERERQDEADRIRMLEEEEREHWTKDPSIKNPKWYIKSIDNPPDARETPLPIFVAMSMFKRIPLIRALRAEGFNLVEREEVMHSADMVLSPSTAVVFRNLSELSYTYDQLLQDLKDACTRFTKVIVIFETIPFSASEKNLDAKKTTNPITREVQNGIETIKRLLPMALQSTNRPTGKVDLVFAYNGATEVVMALMCLMDEEGKKMLKKDKNGHKEVYEDRSWLEKEPVEQDLDLLMKHFGLNIFCAWYALLRYGTAQDVITGMNNDERKKAFEHVFGEDALVRSFAIYVLNRSLRELV